MAGDQGDDLPHPQRLGQRGGLRRHPEADTRGGIARRPPEEPDGAGVGSPESRRQGEQRRLPRPVRTEQPDRLAGPHLQVDAVERDVRPEAASHPGEVEDDVPVCGRGRGHRGPFRRGCRSRQATGPGSR